MSPSLPRTYLENSSMVAFDTETCLIQPGLQAPPLVCMSVAPSYPATPFLVGWRDAEDVMASILDSTDVIVGHNIAFDFMVVWNQFPRLGPKIFKAYDDDRIEDTELRQKLVDIAGGVYRSFTRQDGVVEKIHYRLGDVAKRHFGLIMDKDTWRLRYGELRDVPVRDWPDGARKYALDDAHVTGEVWRIQEPNRMWLGDQHRQSRAAFWLKLMSAWGLHTDATAVRAFAEGMQKEYARLAQILVAHKLLRPDRRLKSGKRKGLIVPGARDTKAAAARITAAYGGNPPRTDKGQACLDDAACKASKDPVLIAYADFSSTKKNISTDVPLLESGTVTPIHSHFEELLETGRTSSSPNVQNLSRRGGIRECFRPRPGYVYASADYKGMELCTWSQVCIKLLGYSKMAEVINSKGASAPHMQMAAAILGISVEEAEANKKTERVDDARQTAKILNFGLPGGLGAETFVEYAAARDVFITLQRSQELKQLWLTTWPEAGEYLRYIGKLVDPRAGGLPQMEQMFAQRFRGGVSYTECANGFFQGLAADVAKYAGWLVCKACYNEPDSVLYGSRIVNFVHDELILESPEELGHECLAELSRLMLEATKAWLPDVKAETDGVLMKYWSKKAEQVVKDGRVVAWG